MNHRKSCRSRGGFTLVEALVGLAVVLVCVLLAIPLVFRGMESFRRRACGFNMHRMGDAFQAYRTSFAGKFPVGASYQTTPNETPYGPSWWKAILPLTDQGEAFKGWKNVDSSGSFNSKTPNPNVKFADGFRPTFMFCPSSPLPQGNDPLKNISAENRELLKPKLPEGIPVSTYAAVSGSSPDMGSGGGGKAGGSPFGRNTKDGVFGILSGSGVFPPNLPVAEAAIRDGGGFTIAVVEQSDVWYDPGPSEAPYDNPVPYDLRSGWPGGAFMGSGGNYTQVSTGAEGIDGNGEARVLNCTSVRYPVNTKMLQAGMFADPLEPIPPPKEGEKRPPVVKRPPGPGHNNGVFSCHPGGAQALFADGSVKWLNQDLDLRVLLLLCTRDDNQATEGF